MKIDIIDYVYNNVSDSGEVIQNIENPVVILVPTKGNFECFKSIMLEHSIGKKYGIIQYSPMVNNQVQSRKYFFKDEVELIDYCKINFPEYLDYVIKITEWVYPVE